MSSPDLTEAERKAVLAVLNTTRLSMGPEVDRFERAIAERVGVKHAIAVSSGTAGLHLCIRAAGISDGDLVLTTPFSFVASANVMLYERAIPVFIDVDPNTGNIDPEMVAQAASDLRDGGKAANRWLPRKGGEGQGSLKALLPVDVFGQPADFDSLRATSNQHNLTLIEDSCEALGSIYAGMPAGVLGDLGIFAFYPNKQITTAEGGMVVTDDETYAAAIRAMRNQGRAPGDTWLEHTYLGYNYRLDELSAALGRVQMERLDELLDKRKKVADWYQTRLETLAYVEPVTIASTTDRMSWFVFVVRLQHGLDRVEVAKKLEVRGIPTRPYFVPIHTQPYFVERFGYQTGDFPITEDLGNRCLALPFSGVMSEAQVDYVCEQIAEVVNY
jgi:dTDP-4-amino-4,6-dideoxygalactose transaminase